MSHPPSSSGHSTNDAEHHGHPFIPRRERTLSQ